MKTFLAAAILLFTFSTGHCEESKQDDQAPDLISSAKGTVYTCAEPDPKPFNICYMVGDYRAGAELPEYNSPPDGTEINIIYHQRDINNQCARDCVGRDIMEVYKTDVIIPEKYKKGNEESTVAMEERWPIEPNDLNLTGTGVGIVFNCPAGTNPKFKTCFKLNGTIWKTTTEGMEPKAGDKIKVMFTLNKVPESDANCSNYGDEMYVTDIEILGIFED